MTAYNPETRTIDWEQVAINGIRQNLSNRKDAHTLIAAIRKHREHFAQMNDTRAMRNLASLEHMLVKLHDGIWYELGLIQEVTP